MPERIGEIIAGVCLVSLLLWAFSPADDQVCRMDERPLFDWIYGVSHQPTCQSLIDRIESSASNANRRAADLESRVDDLEEMLKSRR